MKRELPRFEVIQVQAGSRLHYLAYDHLTKLGHPPMDVRSKEQAQSLVELLAMTARSNGEPLSLMREDRPPVKKD